MRRELALAGAFLLLVAVLARAQTFANPVIGYDEQFYLLVGDRMLKGALPYVDIFDRKPIGLFLIYALARLVPLDPFVSYKLLALAFLSVTALGVYGIARQASGRFAALAAATAFILWHDFMGGEGGQSPVFYDLFMQAGALLVLRAIRQPGRLGPLGCGAMLCVGLALQVKYSVLGEGVYFGCALLWMAWRLGRGWRVVLGWGVAWIAAALASTALVLGVYALLGHADAFLFTNFATVFAQGRNPLAVQLLDLAETTAILAPLLLILAVGQARGMLRDRGAEGLFLWGWLAASILGLLAFWRFNSPHYALPVLLPLTMLMAPVFDARPRRPLVTVLLLGAAMVMAQVVLADHARRRGGPLEAAMVAQAARGGQGCIYVHAGYPALYMLTGSCLPSRWAFPGSLNMQDEAKPQAIGVDPAREVARILATRPPAIVDEWPVSRFGNRATQALVDRALRRDYALAARVALPGGRAQLVYRLRSGGVAVSSADAAAGAGPPASAASSARAERISIRPSRNSATPIRNGTPPNISTTGNIEMFSAPPPPSVRPTASKVSVHSPLAPPIKMPRASSKPPNNVFISGLPLPERGA